MIKVLFSDLDGTLLSVFGERKGVTITDANKVAVKKLLASGVKFCIASGRNSIYTDEVLKELDLKDGDVIACNGGTVSMEGKKTINTIDEKSCLEFIDYYYDHVDKDAYRLWGVEADNTYVADFVDEYFINRYGKSTYKMTTEYSLKEYVNNPKEYQGFQKLMIAIIDGNIEKGHKLFEDPFVNTLDIGCPVPKQIELMRKGVNKGTAIDFYINHYGYTIDEIAAVGDANNDIPMLQKAKYSYCMESGEEMAKSMAYKTVVDVAGCIEDILKINGND